MAHVKKKPQNLKKKKKPQNLKKKKKKRIQPHIASMLWDTSVSCTSSHLPAFLIGIFICCLQILAKASDSYFRQNQKTLHNIAIAFPYMAYSPLGILIGKTDKIVRSSSSDEK